MVPAWRFLHSFASLVGQHVLKPHVILDTDNYSYKSVVYLSIGVPDYDVLFVGESFVRNPARPESLTDQSSITQTIYKDVHNHAYSRLEVDECIRAYAKRIQSERGNLVLVASKDMLREPAKPESLNDSLSPVLWSMHYDAKDTMERRQSGPWICKHVRMGPSCDRKLEDFQSNYSGWHFTIYGKGRHADFDMNGSLDYCLSENATQHCKNYWNLPFAAIVVAVNFLKAVLMFYTALGIQEQPLMTMGDAVVSFLTMQDPTTTDRSVMAIENVPYRKRYRTAWSHSHNWRSSAHWWADLRGNRFRPSITKEFSRHWSGSRYRWKDNTNRTRRVVTFWM